MNYAPQSSFALRGGIVHGRICHTRITVSSLIQTVLSAPESSPDRLGFSAQFAGFTAGREFHPSPKKLQVAAAIICLSSGPVNHFVGMLSRIPRKEGRIPAANIILIMYGKKFGQDGKHGKKEYHHL